jgi:hypothetical protein
MFGWTALEAIGKSFMALIVPPRMAATHIPVVERYVRGGTPQQKSLSYTMTASYRDTDEEFHLEVILTPQAQESGVMTFTGVGRKLMPA